MLRQEDVFNQKITILEMELDIMLSEDLKISQFELLKFKIILKYNY
jgi:hypothetical protein